MRKRQEPKRYYGYVQSKTALRQLVGTLENPGGGLLVSDYENCETLRRYFETVYKMEDGRVVPRGLLDTPPVDDVEDSVSSVLDVMEGLNVNKSAGSDGLHPTIIKLPASLLALAISALYQESLKAGKVPKHWATATVVSVQKSGDRQQPGNCRPVSLTSVLCEGLETIVRNALCEHVTRHRRKYKEGRWRSESRGVLPGHPESFRLGKSPLSDSMVADVRQNLSLIFAHVRFEYLSQEEAESKIVFVENDILNLTNVASM
ncbi:unnamed protein product [Echinostoma caproni]|uniref:Reverse transcriptase domain-containing protein n=1 Tax=Echinostoma caproni TaxID=27848 RepID=A0A183B9R6_9TREM|nr:unnamed protein product [Echinostoma caproni]